MAGIKPFTAIRPQEEYASHVAALPYDVYNREEAKAEAGREKLSFLRIDRAETQLPDSIDTYDERVYQKAKQLYGEMKERKIFLKDDKPCYYVYQLAMDGRKQTGIVACASVDDYLNNIIKKHENTREEKEQDRIRHVDALSAQTGPIFLAYRSEDAINRVVADLVESSEPIYDFTADDGVSHTVWRMEIPGQIKEISDAFGRMDDIYIADGHHRAASAVKVSLRRREAKADFDGSEEFNYFLSVLFPDDQLMIMDYNRVVKDLNGLAKEEFLQEIGKHFTISKLPGAKSPEKKGQVAMYLEKEWYLLCASEELLGIDDAVASLDVSLLQDYLLGPVLGIGDPRTDNRIDFVGGIRGLGELERRADSDMKVAFAMYPTSIAELFAVADAGLLMPPKSTWFEPKLRSGLFIHEI